MAEASTSVYALGSTDAEHQRLMRQAAWLAPHTERFFRDAGIGPGQRVLDVGSGVGDVALIAARLVGPSGEVVGIERDTRSAAASLLVETFQRSGTNTEMGPARCQQSSQMQGCQSP